MHRPARRKWLLTGGLALCGASVCIYGSLKRVAGRPCTCATRAERPAPAAGCRWRQPRRSRPSWWKWSWSPLTTGSWPSGWSNIQTSKRAALLAELADAESLMNEAAELRGAGVYDKALWEKQFYPAKARADAARAAMAALPDPDVELLRTRSAAGGMRCRCGRGGRCWSGSSTVWEVKPATARGRSTMSTAERIDSRTETVAAAGRPHFRPSAGTL